MTLREPNPELSVRWSEWLRRHNRRGMQTLLRIVLCLFPAFGVLDLLAAPTRSRPWSEFIVRVPSSSVCREAAS